MIHAHITSWVVALILFFVVYFLQKGGKAKGAKIVQMVLRLFYVLIILTGGMLLMGSGYTVQYMLKAAMGIWVIALFEMILGKAARGHSTKILWLQFVIAFVLVLYLGFKLPMSFLNP